MDDNIKLLDSVFESTSEADPAETLSRREFAPRAAAALAGIMLLPRHVLGGRGYTAPSEKLTMLNRDIQRPGAMKRLLSR